jgi:hypothetical protein
MDETDGSTFRATLTGKQSRSRIGAPLSLHFHATWQRECQFYLRTRSQRRNKSVYQTARIVDAPEDFSLSGCARSARRRMFSM